MLLAFSSDNHLDANHLVETEILQQQATWLTDHQVDYYFHLGDLFNDFSRTAAYFQQLQLLVPQTTIKFLAGNHELINHASYQRIQTTTMPQYFHHQTLNLPGTNWQVLGLNGWYDYQFSSFANQPAAIQHWKRAYWLDSVADQPVSDWERNQIEVNWLQTKLTKAQANHKQVLVVTHFAPLASLLPALPSQLDAKHTRAMAMMRAFYGSPALGAVLTQAAAVQQVYFGHVHQATAWERAQTKFHNVAVGVKRRRYNEWQADTFMAQWVAKLKLKKV